MVDFSPELGQNCTAKMLDVLNSRRGTSALVLLLVAAFALGGFHYLRQPWLAETGAFLFAAAVVLAVPQSSWIWDAIITLSLAMAAFQSWSEQKYFLTVLLGVCSTVVFIKLLRKTQSLKPREHVRQWPLTKGGFSGNYEDGDERVIYYGYEVGGSYYSGYVPAGSVLKLRVKSQLDALKGKPAVIRYKPDQPEVSTVLKSDQTELPA